jgi:hypothetical protein
MFLITEAPSVIAKPIKIQKVPKKDFIRLECVLQSMGEFNKNKRRYDRNLMESGISKVQERIQEGSFLGELDHPVDTKPNRQVTVLFEKASHRILEYGWDGNKLMGFLETLDTPCGHIERNLALQGVPVGYSFRGMGELRPVNESGKNGYDVVGPLHVVTWDAVSNPSHSVAKIRKINESVLEDIYENALNIQSNSTMLNESEINESDGLICTNEGYCYLPNQFDELVEQKCIKLMNKFS